MPLHALGDAEPDDRPVHVHPDAVAIGPPTPGVDGSLPPGGRLAELRRADGGSI